MSGARGGLSQDVVIMKPLRGRTSAGGGLAARDPGEPEAEGRGAERRWLSVASPADRETDWGAGGQGRTAWLYVQVIVMSVVVVLGVAFFAASASRRVAEDQAVDVAADRANLLAELVVQPALTDGVLTRDRAAVAKLGTAVQRHMVGLQITRVKFWTADGLVVYASNPRLVGQRFPLSKDHQAVLADARLRAVVAD